MEGEGEDIDYIVFINESTMCVVCIMGALCSGSSFGALLVPGTGVCNATSYNLSTHFTTSYQVSGIIRTYSYNTSQRNRRPRSSLPRNKRRNNVPATSRHETRSR